MRRYAQVSPRFWTGRTGRQIKAAGKDAVILACYLMTAPGANLVGLYYCPLWKVSGETPLHDDEVAEALDRLRGLGFVEYDDEVEVVYVCKMVLWQVGDRLVPGDNREKAIRREVVSCVSDRLRARWIRDHGEAFGLAGEDGPQSGDQLREGSPGSVLREAGDRGSGGASKPLVPAPAPFPDPVEGGPGGDLRLPSPADLEAYPPKPRRDMIVRALIHAAEAAGFFTIGREHHPVKSALERIDSGATPHEVESALWEAIEAKRPREEIRSMFWHRNWSRRKPTGPTHTPESAWAEFRRTGSFPAGWGWNGSGTGAAKQ